MNRQEHLENVKRIRADAKRECTGCCFQCGKYCGWRRLSGSRFPPCQRKTVFPCSQADCAERDAIGEENKDLQCTNCRDSAICAMEGGLYESEHKPDAVLTATYFNFSPVTDEGDGEILPPFFSCFACQTCGSPFHGDRYYISATIGEAHTGSREKLEVCTDCFQHYFT